MSREHLPPEVISLIEEELGIDIFFHDKRWRKEEAERRWGPGGYRWPKTLSLPRRAEYKWIVRAVVFENWPEPTKASKIVNSPFVKGVMTQTEVYEILQALVRRGELLRVRAGFYTLPSINSMELAWGFSIVRVILRHMVKVERPPAAPKEKRKPEPGKAACPYCNRSISLETGHKSSNPKFRNKLVHDACMVENEVGKFDIKDEILAKIMGEY